MSDPVLTPAAPVAPAAPVTPAAPAVNADPAATLYPTTPPATDPATNPPPAADPAKADSTPKEGEDPKKDEPKKEGAPEKYEDFKLPEGIEVDPKAMEQFTPLAKELNLSQEQAQKLIDLQTALTKEAVTQQQAAWEKVTTDWRTAAETDKEYGGLQFKENVALANTALAKFGTPELFKALVDTGVGDHPEMIRTFYRIGKAMAEDKMRVGNPNAGGPVDPAKILFPNQN